MRLQVSSTQRNGRQVSGLQTHFESLARAERKLDAVELVQRGCRGLLRLVAHVRKALRG